MAHRVGFKTVYTHTSYSLLNKAIYTYQKFRELVKNALIFDRREDSLDALVLINSMKIAASNYNIEIVIYGIYYWVLLKG
jgi:hypothetical protein